jgi:hypothetical protein
MSSPANGRTSKGEQVQNGHKGSTIVYNDLSYYLMMISSAERTLSTKHSVDRFTGRFGLSAAFIQNTNKDRIWILIMARRFKHTALGVHDKSAQIQACIHGDDLVFLLLLTTSF